MGISVLPDSIPESLWAEFRKHRKRLKAPMTDHAEELILQRLEKWRKENGANPVEVLEESIMRGWRGIFLNGHGKTIDQQPKMETCCSCGGSLQSGYVYTSLGKQCHACR